MKIFQNISLHMKNSLTQISQRNTTHFSDIRTLNMRNVCLQTYGNNKILFRIQETKPIQDGGGGAAKWSPTSFSPVTSTNVGTSPQNFLTFSFNPFATLV